jgi:hypothetical protein
MAETLQETVEYLHFFTLGNRAGITEVLWKVNNLLVFAFAFRTCSILARSLQRIASFCGDVLLPSFQKNLVLEVQVSLDKYKRRGRSPEQVPQPTGTSFLIEPRADKVGILRNAAKGQAFEPREGRYLIFIARGAANPTSSKLGLVL